MITVTALSITPVKATRLQTVDQVELDLGGAVGNRSFYVIDGRGRMINAKGVGELTCVVAELTGSRLTLSFPDGSRSEGEVALGEKVTTRFFSHERDDGRIVEGPWAGALSEYLGREVRLVAARAVDRGPDGGVTLISRASLRALADAAGEQDVDARRFRMLVEVDGIGAHAEDAWVQRSLRIGAATVRFRGHVGRCLITSRHPETGEVDLPTLDVLGSYRREVSSTEPLPFGIYGEVLEAATVRVGDEVTPLD